jgi:hypothetical protein
MQTSKGPMPTWFTATPTIHVAIIEYLRSAFDRVPANSLRFIRSGAAALSPQDAKARQTLLLVSPSTQHTL